MSSQNVGNVLISKHINIFIILIGIVYDTERMSKTNNYILYIYKELYGLSICMNH